MGIDISGKTGWHWERPEKKIEGEKKDMRKLVSILLILAVAISLLVMPAVVGAATYDSSLVLEDKDASWDVISGGMAGLLQYNSFGNNFNYSFSAMGLGLTTGYSLIYYADMSNRYTDWGGNNPGALIATFTTDGSGNIAATSGSIDLGMDLPSPSDSNICEHDYCVSDDYTNCHGAKIWLVPTSTLPGNWPSDTAWTTWNRTSILFETDLIWYDDLNVGSTGPVGLTTNIPDIVAISVNPSSLNFGTLVPGGTSNTLDIIVTNVGTRTVNVGADVSGPALFLGNLWMTNNSSWSTRSWSTLVTGLLMGASDGVQTKLLVPSTYTPGGVETATLLFTATGA